MHDIAEPLVEVGSEDRQCRGARHARENALELAAHLIAEPNEDLRVSCGAAEFVLLEHRGEGGGEVLLACLRSLLHLRVRADEVAVVSDHALVLH